MREGGGWCPSGVGIEVERRMRTSGWAPPRRKRRPLTCRALDARLGSALYMRARARITSSPLR
jgi:hypothetical protein